jgi:hypothetical protein
VDFGPGGSGECGWGEWTDEEGIGDWGLRNQVFGKKPGF